MKCCGEERQGNFCQECGKAMGSTLNTLLRYVTSHAQTGRKRHETRKQHFEKQEGGLTDRGTRHLDAIEKTALKWEGWQAALKEVMQAQKVSP